MVISRKRQSNGIDSVLVAVSGAASDENTVRLAAELVSLRRGLLYILHVIEVERGLPVDSELTEATIQGEALLDTMETAVSPFKCEVRAELLQSRRAGHAIVHEAADKQVEAIVIGMPFRRQYGVFTLGDAIPYVLQHAPCRVIFSREAISTGLDENADL